MYDFKHSVVNGNDPDGELSFLKQLNPTYMEMADTAGPVDHLQLTRYTCMGFTGGLSTG